MGYSRELQGMRGLLEEKDKEIYKLKDNVTVLADDLDCVYLAHATITVDLDAMQKKYDKLLDDKRS